MRKITCLLVICLVLVLGTGCSSSKNSTNVVEINESQFLAQTTEIYYNSADYIGKTIKYEGIFSVYEVSKTDKCYLVTRYGPGCCADDSEVGFEIQWDGVYPAENDWVEITGILEEYTNNSKKYLRIAVSELNVLTKRGAETVSR